MTQLGIARRIRARIDQQTVVNRLEQLNATIAALLHHNLKYSCRASDCSVMSDEGIVRRRSQRPLKLVLWLAICAVVLSLAGIVWMFLPDLRLQADWQMGAPEIEALGGSIPARWTAAAENGWLTIEQAAAGINFDGSAVRDGDLAVLKNFPNVYQVSLRGTRITDAGLVHLKAMPNLTVVHLDGTSVSSRAKSELKEFLSNR